MKVKDLIAYLETLNQDYVVEVGYSEYPNEVLGVENIGEYKDEQKYIIY